MSLRIGILGAAAIAPAAVLRPARRRDDVEVAAVAARSAERADAYARQHGIARAYGSYEELVADPAIDLVYVALPNSLHAEWSIAALRAGKHVLCEKPFAMNATEARRMTEAAGETGRRLIEAFHDDYHPLAARTAELAAEIGPIRSVEAVFLVTNRFEPGALRHEPSLGGGALMDLGCYAVHGVRRLLGEEPTVVSATAVLGPAGVDESIEARLEFPSGAIAMVRASMAAEFANWIRFESDTGRVEIEGVVFPARGHSIRSRISGVERVQTVGGDETYDHQLAAIVQALKDGTPLPTEGDDPVANMVVIDAIYAVAGVHRPVPTV
ncbi:Gfo/Idh/MocA family protein [Lysobacter korlensis]|uniref:Gfo/Idh/MocA family protein n=1 Tax=Lysobacter korlensis TaxID=553636 RepID=A0ABV6RVM3_9GAMM